MTAARDGVIQELLVMGLPRLQAALTANVLLYAERCGRASHGTRLITAIRKNIEAGIICREGSLLISDKLGPITKIDCGYVVGYAAASIAMRLATATALRHGVAAVGLYNINHIGSLGAYCEIAAMRNCFSIVSAAGRPRVPLYGTVTPFLGTMPIAIGVPGRPPVIVDLCLAEASVYQLERLMECGQGCGREVGWDRDGRPTQEPKKVLEGAIAPIGGHKGAALAFAVSLLLQSLVKTHDQHSFPVLMVTGDSRQFPGFEEQAKDFVGSATNLCGMFAGSRVPGIARKA